MKTKKRKLILPGFLVTGLVAGLLTMGGAASPAAAGTGVAQDVSAVLNLATKVINAPVDRCTKETGCQPVLSVGPTGVTKLELKVLYTYTPTSVNDTPDVVTQAGLLKGLIEDWNKGCNDKYGIAISATQAKFTSSGATLLIDGTEYVNRKPATLAEASSVDEVFCLPV